MTSPSSSGPSPHSQLASSESPFGSKHITGSQSPATGNLMSPAPLQSSQSNVSPLQSMHQKSGHPPSQIPSNSPANMQLQPGSQIQTSSTGTNLMAGPPGSFNTAGSISSRLGPPPPTHPFPPSPLHSSTNSQQQQALIALKQNETENRDKSSHSGLAPPPIMNGYLPQFANNGAGQHAQSNAASRISPHANSMPSTATPPGPQGIPTSHQPNQILPQSSGASISKPSSLSTTTSASFHSSSLPSSMPTSHPSSSSAVTSIAKFANISSSNSGMPPIQTGAGLFPGGLPPGLPPGVAPPGMIPGAIPPNGITPMLLHSSPYRPPYPNYPLYAPYSGLPHSPYLPPAVPSPSASPRTSRESPMMQQMSKPPSLRPPTPVSQSSNTGHSSGPIGNSGSGSSTPTSSTPTTVPTPTSAASTAANLSQHGLPPSSMAPHILHHPHLPYPQSLQMQQQILGGPMPPSHHQPLSAGLLPHPSVSHSAHSIANVTTTTSASTPLSATISGGSSGLSTSSPLVKDGTQLLAPPHPHLLGHPHLAPPHMAPLPPHMLPPHPALLRGASPTTPISSNNTNTQPPSIGTTTPTSSTSVIHKGVSPQTESPSKERSDNNVAYLPRSSATNTHLSSGLPLTASSASSSSSASPYIPTCAVPALPIPHSVASLAISSNASYSSTASLPTTTHASGVVPMMATQLHQPPPGNLQYGPVAKGPPSMWPPSR